MKGITPCVLALLLAACGPKHSGSSGVDTDGATHGGQTSAATATRGGSSSTTAAEERVVYDAHCALSTIGPPFVLTVYKHHLDAGFCSVLGFVATDDNNSGQLGIDYPPNSGFELKPPSVVSHGNCILESPEDAALALDASGTVWWDEAMTFVDVDVTLTLPPDPRWPDTDVLFVEGLPIEGGEDCAPVTTGGSGGSG